MYKDLSKAKQSDNGEWVEGNLFQFTNIDVYIVPSYNSICVDECGALCILEWKQAHGAPTVR